MASFQGSVNAYFSFCRDARRVGNGDLRRKERHGAKKSRCQSVRAWEQTPGVGLCSRREGGSARGKEKDHTSTFQGRRCGDNHLLLGCWDVKDGCEQDWDSETWALMSEWVGKPLLTVCIAPGSSGHHQYLHNMRNWFILLSISWPCL